MIVILNQFLSIIFYFFIFLCWLVWYLSCKLLLKFIRFIDESNTLNLALFEIYLFNKNICNKISLYVKKKLVKSFKINFGL